MELSMIKILAFRWFTAHTLIGIVRVQTKYDGIHYYIGGVPHPSNESTDAEYIADWGSHFPSEAGDILFGIPIRVTIPS